MLFNSPEFIFFFLPITLILFFKLGHSKRYIAALVWLIVTSLFFYAWWNPLYLGLMFASIVANYLLGSVLNKRESEGGYSDATRKRILTFGVVTNLAFLGYFKYANFFVNTLNNLGFHFHIDSIALPLAISFFTFTQIAYLVDTYKKKTKAYNFLHYFLFVIYFPHLIAGPIVHHKELIPQFEDKRIFKFDFENFSVGLTIFVIGLFKKLIIADRVALYVTPIFDAIGHNYQPSFVDAWTGTLAYTFQLYFDFSGYSDMAIGLSRLFGIYLPLNFYSPYKSRNIVEFWKRWHITLSGFLRDYLYIPLGGNRKGSFNRYRNLMLTMLLGGLWHGAGWTFVIWGALHGAYLVANHFWHGVKARFGLKPEGNNVFTRAFAQLLTFVAVLVAWVFFRAKTFGDSISVLKGLIGLNGVIFPESYLGHFNRISSFGTRLADMGVQFKELNRFGGIQEIACFALLFIIVWGLPNTQQLVSGYHQYLDMYKKGFENFKSHRLSWLHSHSWAIYIGALFVISILSLYRLSEFLYFQF